MGCSTFFLRDRNLVKQLDFLIRDCNPYAALYKNMNLLALEENQKALIENTQGERLRLRLRHPRLSV